MSIQRYNYSDPQKRIHDSQGLRLFQSSIALNQLQLALSKIIKLIESKDVPIGVLHKEDLYTDEEIAHYEHESEAAIPSFSQAAQNQLQQIYEDQPIVKAIVDLLTELSKLIDLTPPFAGPRRYGNLACRDWHTKVEATIEQLLRRYVLPFYKLENPEGFILEIKWYILNCFGSKERLDYGTGHELNFLAFLTGLDKVGVLKFDEFNGYDVLVIFGAYYNLVRKLITTYTLEPAGSHGVWGLDDHFHIIYILGASQILNDSDKTSVISPKFLNNRSVVYKYSSRNLYFNSIGFIYKVKKGPFFEHSPILYDISNVKNWEKILKGLLKMFQVEVIGKFPVVQHFYFGNVLFQWKSLNGVDLPIHTSDEDLTDKEIKDINHDWDSKVPKKEIPVTTPAPWKNKSVSLQDRINSSSLRRTPSPITSSTKTSPASAATTATQGFIETTRAPWAKK